MPAFYVFYAAGRYFYSAMVEEVVESDKWTAAEREAASDIAAGFKTRRRDRKVKTIETGAKRSNSQRIDFAEVEISNITE